MFKRVAATACVSVLAFAGFSASAQAAPGTAVNWDAPGKAVNWDAPGKAVNWDARGKAVNWD